MWLLRGRGPTAWRPAQQNVTEKTSKEATSLEFHGLTKIRTTALKTSTLSQLCGVYRNIGNNWNDSALTALNRDLTQRLWSWGTQPGNGSLVTWPDFPYLDGSPAPFLWSTYLPKKVCPNSCLHNTWIQSAPSLFTSSYWIVPVTTNRKGQMILSEYTVTQYSISQRKNKLALPMRNPL